MIRPRRSVLYMPGSNARAIEKARTLPADGVILDLDMSVVSSAREMQVLFPKAVAGQANEDELARFAALWQARVEQMLVKHADDPDLVWVREWKDAA